jgi:hypothetical protein
MVVPRGNPRATGADYPLRRGGLPRVNFAELRVLTVMTPADFEGDAEPAEDGRALTSRCSPDRVSGLRSSPSPIQAAGDTFACNLPATRRTMQHRECADDPSTAAFLRPSSDRFGQVGKASPSMRENQTPGCASSPPPIATEETGTPFLADAEPRRTRSDRALAPGADVEAYTCESISKGHHRMPYYSPVYLTIIIGQAPNAVVFWFVDASTPTAPGLMGF